MDHALTINERHRRILFFALAAVGLALLLLFAFPQKAYAFDIFDIEGSIKDEWLKPAINGCFNGYHSIVNAISSDNLITGSFENLFGEVGASNVYNIISGVHKNVLVPIGESILALVMLVQVVKISQRIDANGTLPAVKEIVFLGVFYVLFHWLIVNSLGLCEAAFNVAGSIINGFSAGEFNITSDTADYVGDTSLFSIGDLIMVLLSSILVWIMGIISSVVVYFVSGARALQIYCYAVFSPIPFSLLGFEETRSFGLNFCRNFIAVCLAGAIIVFVLAIFPNIIASISLSDGVSAMTGGVVNISIIKTIAFCLLFILALVKSGAWAREIIGG